MLQKVEIEVSKEMYELGKGLTDFVAAVKKELDDNGGWDAADDLPGVISAAVMSLLPAMEGVSNISLELEEDKAAFARAVLVSLSGIADVFTKKEPA